jgi:hypothetical protein
MSWISCCQCGERFGLNDGTHETLRRSSQAFHCPWGHANHYPQGPSEADTLRQERDRLKQEAARLEDEKRIAWSTASQQLELRRAAERRASAARGQVTKLKKRTGAGVCPCCNRTFSALARHMATKHPTFIAEEVAPEGATIQ